MRGYGFFTFHPLVFDKFIYSKKLILYGKVDGIE